MRKDKADIGSTASSLRVNKWGKSRKHQDTVLCKQRYSSAQCKLHASATLLLAIWSWTRHGSIPECDNEQKNPILPAWTGNLHRSTKSGTTGIRPQSNHRTLRTTGSQHNTIPKHLNHRDMIY